MNPKLADFGFAMELPQLSHGTTVFLAEFIARSDGYFPSEITSGTLSDRSDVYSYGIVSVCAELYYFHSCILHRSSWKHLLGNLCTIPSVQTRNW